MNKNKQIDEALAYLKPHADKKNQEFEIKNLEQELGDFEDELKEALADELPRQQCNSMAYEALEFMKSHQWQDISTAPKDGTWIQILVKVDECGGLDRYTGYYRFKNCAWRDALDYWIDSKKVTHWMPLPSAPKGEE